MVAEYARARRRLSTPRTSDMMMGHGGVDALVLIRAAQPSELPLIVALVEAEFAAELPRAQLEKALLRAAPGLLLVAAEDDELAGVCLANGQGHLALIAVAAQRRRRGIGRALVRELVARLLAAGRSRVTTQYGVGSLFPGVRERRMVGFFEALGFSRTSCECTMRATLPISVVPVAPPGITLAEYGASWRPALHEMIDRELPRLWRDTVDQSAQGSVLLALSGERLAGFCVCSLAQPTSYFGPMAVARRLRRQRIGTFLVASGLERLARAGGQAAELWVDRDSFQTRSLYAPLGFSISELWFNFEYGGAG